MGVRKNFFFLLLKKLGLSADKNGALIAGLKKWHKEITYNSSFGS